MPHQSVKVLPGVDTNETPALNQTGLSFTQLVRFVFDRNGLGLVEKLGGWSKFFPNTIAAPVRALWAWEDTNAVKHLGYGTQNIGVTGHAQLGVTTNGVQLDITPTSTTDNVTPAATTISGNSAVVITDTTTTGITSYDAVYIETHMSVGGVVLFGLYAATELSSTTYSVQAVDVLGNPLLATSSTSTTTVASFATSSGTNVITVTLANHGYAVGDTYPVLVSTTVGGVTLFGNYLVTAVTDANTFTILSATNASSSTSASINGGNARFIYSFGIGAIPSGTGYGIGGYGRGAYGRGTAITPGTGNKIAATDWSLANWGEIFLACPINGSLFQPIYQWDPISGSPLATVIPNAPPLNDGFFVAMPERQIVAWGSTTNGIQDPLLIRWCDVSNFNVWIGTIQNQAGEYRIPRGSRIVGGIQGPQQCLIWTDINIWSMQYVGQPYVFSFNEVGFGCGLISRKAAASLNGVVYWMGPSQFFALTADGVAPIPCPVWDVIFQDLDQSNLDKIRVATNALFGEIAWYYPTLSSGGEVAAYVKYNVYMGIQGLQAWDFGALARSAWVDQSVLGQPIGADPNAGYLYQHETSPDADGMPMLSSFTTGFFEAGDGENMIFIDQWFPDMKWSDYGGSPSATVNLTIYGADYAGQTPVAYGPWSLTVNTTFISPRLRHRLIAFSMSSNDIGSFWRIGSNRYRYSIDGKF